MTDRRTALITGGSRRVGRAICLRLARGGFDIFFTFNKSVSDAEALVKEINLLGRRADIFQVDLETENAALMVSDWMKLSSKRLDVLVNNAAMYLPDRASDLTMLSKRHQCVNHDVPVALTHALSSLLCNTGGHVIQMLDILAEKPMPGYSAYCASKAAMLNATLSLARQLAPEVTVNGISPGVVDWAGDMPLGDREKYLQRVPLRRAGTPLDVANLVHFLVTEGTYITGQNIRVDGGRSIV